MKRLNYLIAMALMAFTFTSCEDVPNPFGQIVPPSGGGDDVVEFEPAGSGTLADPYNVQAIINTVSALEAGVGLEKEMYVKGYVTSIPNNGISASYNNATFYISDDKEGNNRFYIYRAKGLGGGDITDESFIKVGDEVVVYGNGWVNYNGNTPETQQGKAYVYSVNGNTGGGDTPAPTPGEAKGKGTADDPFNIAAAIKKCQEVGETASTDKYYIKGIVVKGGTVSGGYGNLTFTLGDTKDATEVFTAFQVAGTDGEKLEDGYEVKAGSEVVIYGPVVNYKGNTPETSGKSAAQIVTIDGKKTSEGGGGDTPTPSGDNDGSLEKPFTPAEANAFIATLAADTNTDKDYYIKGKIVNYAKNGEFGTQYGNASFYISADGSESGEQFYVFRTLYLGNVKYSDESAAKPAVGDEVVICGKLVNYQGKTPETVANKSYIYSWDKQGGGSDTPAGGNDGSLAKPFTPVEANAFIATLAADTNTENDYYIKGKIVKYANNGEFGTQYGNASFYISADGSESGEQFYVFRTLYLGNKKYSDDSWAKPKAGDEVIICGKLVNYKGNTPETVANKSYIYSLNGKTE